ncbi:DNA alkylation repair protein [Streptomyces sp. SID13031]|uniref:DNA alkylation repair protein n=1 Tax=Streptomyces sp. SID13031 TaxID=2706046 RepID=UPI0013CCEE03|nr:DNA alkylation repair protein [Streptomyces sp. SID13031]NEA34215.1 DNA alkylation repair protein [Streptomyces sp. SID13031]
MELTAAALVAALREYAKPGEVTHKHYPGAGEVLGVPMRSTFDTAKAFTAMSFAEVERLLDEASYEGRLAGFCVLDFKARGKRTTDDERQAAYELYLRRHDAIDSWDMVDRAAPHVIGRQLLHRKRDPLFALARSADPLRRRTAITAPLYFARFGTPADLTDLFAIAELLLSDKDPVVSKPVGIALKYAGVLDEPALRSFLAKHEKVMQKPTLRYAREKLT